MKTVALIFVFSAILLLSCVASIAQQVAYQSPAGTKFLLYTPPSYSNAGNHPMLISLHGVDEIGDDITKLTNGGPLAPSRLIATSKWPASRPLLVLSPLLSSTVVGPDPEWPANYIDEVVQYVVANYRVDPNRIYITGLSRGGTGVWTYAAAFPNRIAGMVPISGVNDVSTACAIKDIPIWAFHGEADQVIQTFYPIDMANAINNCQPAAKFKPHVSLMEVREHTGWNEVYNESNGYPVFDWLLKFTKGSTTNTAPYVNAGADRQFLMRSGSLHIVGDYFDSDGTINNVQWTKISGPTITLSNTDNKFLTLTNLQTGTFEFQLTVTDDDGAQTSDRVVITILASSTLPVVTDLVLVNGLTNSDIGNLTEGRVINLTTENLSQINIRAAASSAGSVRFSVNSDQNTITVSTAPYLIKPATSPKPEWEIKTGEYLVCGTA
jgi:hypothetical protein